MVACDGARSSVRQLIGQEAKGRTFKDRFLIADVRFKDAVDFPAERWFWFDPPFHPGQSVLLHKQPDGVWRIDFQLGWDADPETEKQPERIMPRVRALLAHSAMKDAQFELEWASVYSFSCERMARFRHGRVLFAGDAAHRRVAVRRARRQLRRAGRREPGVEARRRAAGRAPATRCSTAMAPSANTRPTRTSAIRRAPPTSSRPRARSAGCSAMPRCSWRVTMPSRARWSTAAACPPPPRCTTHR